MFFSSHLVASAGGMPQLVGQVERISTSEKHLPVDLVAEGPPQHLLGVDRQQRGVDRGPSHKGRRPQRRQHLGHPDGVAGQIDIATEGAGGGDLTGHGRRRHLAAGHAVDGVVDEDHRHLLAAVGAVDDLGHPDGGEIAVSLVGEDHQIGPRPLDPRGHRRRPAVRRLVEIGLEVVVGQHRAPHRRHADGPFADPELIEHLGDEAVDRPVGAAGTVVGGDVPESIGFGEHGLKHWAPPRMIRLGWRGSCRPPHPVRSTSHPPD